MNFLKISFILSLFLSINNTYGDYHQAGHPDLIVQTNIDYNWSHFLIEKISKYLETTEFGNPSEKTLDKPIIIEDFIFHEKTEKDSFKSTDAMVKSIRKELHSSAAPDGGSSIMDRLLASKGISKAKFKITIDQLGYKVNRAALGIKPEHESENSLEAKVSIHAGNILIKAEKITIEILLPVKGQYKTFVGFNMARPFIKTPSGYVDEKGVSPTDLSFDFQLKAEKKNGEYNFKLMGSTFDGIEKFIETYGKNIKIDPNLDVTPSPFPLLRLGKVAWILIKDEKEIRQQIKNRQFDLISFLMDKENFGMSKEEAKNAEVRYVDMDSYLEKHQDDLKILLLAEVFKLISSGAGNDLLKKIEQFKIPEASTINGGDIVAKINLNKLATNEENHVVALLSSGFCQGKISKENNNCIKYDRPVRQIPEANLHQSMDAITTNIRNNEADLVVSISEAYITHLLKTTYHAGMWTKALSEQPIEMNISENPNFMFMVLNQVGNFGTLVMDADYVGLQWYEKLAVGKKRMRVALKYKVTIEVVLKKGIPQLEIELADADFSDKVVVYGVPEWGVPSEIQTVKRFKKQVIKEAADEIKRAIGTKIEIPIPELNQLGFSDVQYVRFASDGQGRANLLLKVKDSAKIQHAGPARELRR